MATLTGRTSTAGATGTAGGQPARLPALRRERHPTLVALGALLVLVGALGGLLVQQRASDRIGAVRLTERVPAGQTIPDSAIRSAMVAPDSEIDYVRWDQRGQLPGYYALADLMPGTVLTGGMLTTEQPPADGQLVIGLALSAGEYPTELQVGDHVHAMHVPQGGGDAAGNPVLAVNARVFSIATRADEELAGDASVSLVVSVDAAPALTRAAAAGDVALALIPRTE